MNHIIATVIFLSILFSNTLLNSCDRAIPTLFGGPSSEPYGFARPTLQNATPNSIGLVWENAHGTDLIVQYGKDETMNTRTTASSKPKPNNSFLYHATLTDLQPDTSYFYKIIDENNNYTVAQFKTPPEKGTIKNFHFAVYSDCQRGPSVHRKIIDQGVIPYLQTHGKAGASISDQLGFVLVAGDIVQDGNTMNAFLNRLSPSPIKFPTTSPSAITNAILSITLTS
jgi:phosphodiesterase/alkaline phosphatase D-like protein